MIFNVTWNDPRLSKCLLGRSLNDCEIDLEDIWFPKVYRC